MRRTIGYRDAVALLGGSSPAIDALDRALGGLLLAGTAGGSQLAVSLFDAKGEGIRLGHEILGLLRERLSGYSRYDRTQRLQAAHAVLVITAFFEALDAAQLPFDPVRLRLTSGERRRLARVDGTDPVAALLTADLPVPSPHRSQEEVRAALTRWFGGVAAALLGFVRGLAVWDNLDATVRERASAILANALPISALTRYEELYRRLAVDIPEFAFWSAELDHQATRAAVRGLGFSLARLEEALRTLPAGRAPEARREMLARAARAALGQPILTDGDVSVGTGLTIPTLDAGYIDPHFRVRALGPGSSPAEESWWEGAELRKDLAGFLAGQLTSPGATEAPLLVLGQPGAGKSVLTRVLAARLPPTDFLPVRVVLRDVPADAELQDQLEYAIRDATGESLSWPDLVRSAGDALPVVMLDGFDELLQATGVRQFDYLERVAKFQQREADQDRPVAVVVTSRTAVADRAKAPAGTVGVRLEPFARPQVFQWLAVWNELNAVALTVRGLSTLRADAVLLHRDLAAQPLLLLMLALYDADTNALQRGAGRLDTEELYERLLSTFAEREVRKAHVGATDAEIRALVDHELLRLSVTAFAMFNRNRQWVTVAELNADLANLLEEQATVAAGIRAPLDAGESLVGRFFFVQRAKATRGEDRLATYEFLHATFGEYLVARLVLRLLGDLAVQEAAAAASVFGAGMCQDGMLHALLSFADLTSRSAVIGFLQRLAGRQPHENVQRQPLALFHRLDRRTDMRFTAYEPVRLPAPFRYALYGVNLVLLSVACAGELQASALFPDGDVVTAWRRHCLGWMAALQPDVDGLFQTLEVERCWTGDRRDLRLTIARSPSPARPIDPYWSYDIAPAQRGRGGGWMVDARDQLQRQANFVCDSAFDAMLHAVEPALETLNTAATLFVGLSPEVSTSVLRALVRAWIYRHSAEPLKDAAEAVLSGFVIELPARELLFELVARDAPQLDSATLARWLREILSRGGLSDRHRRLLLGALLNRLATADESDRTDLPETLREMLSETAPDPWHSLRAWVGLGEAGMVPEEVFEAFEEPEVFLGSLPWADLEREDRALVTRARWMVHAIYPAHVGLLPG